MISRGTGGSFRVREMVDGNLKVQIALTHPTAELRLALSQWVLLLVGCWHWSPRGLRSREPTPTLYPGNPEVPSGFEMECRSSQREGGREPKNTATGPLEGPSKGNVSSTEASLHPADTLRYSLALRQGLGTQLL